jgi:hypothetical protein
MKRNPFKWLIVFILFILLMVFFSSCESPSPTGASTIYRVVDGSGYSFDADTVLSAPIPNCIIVQGTNYNCMICGNYTIISKKPQK